MSIDKLCGIGEKITLNEKEYILSPMTVADMGEIGGYVKSQRLKIFETANPNLTLTEKIEIKNQDASIDEINSEMSTISGSIFYIWLSLKHYHPELTLKYVSELINETNYKIINEAINLMSASVDKKKQKDLIATKSQ